MALKWYVSLYTKYGESYVLETYEQYPDLDAAKRVARDSRPEYSTQLYHIERRVGSLCTKSPNTKPPHRESYSQNNKVKSALQHKADAAIPTIRDRIRHLNPNSKLSTIQSIANDIELYKSVWTAEQYKFLMSELAKQPCCTKLLHQYNAKHSASYYI